MSTSDDLTAEERELLPLIEDLQKTYNTRTQDEQDLAAIREQLFPSGSLPAASGTQGHAFKRAIGQEKQDGVLQSSGFPSRRKTSRPSPLSILAATLMTVLLTGSFITSMMLARSHQSATPVHLEVTSTGSSQALTPCDQPNPITGTIIKVSFSTLNSHSGGIVVKGPKEQLRGLLGETFVINFGPDTRLFEQQGKGCHAVSSASIRVGQRIQASPAHVILQSLPPILVGVETLVLLPPSS
jgi:hypothetical protein